MAIRFTCPHCGEVNDVTDDSAGSTGQCAHCGKMIGVVDHDGIFPFGAVDVPFKRRIGVGWTIFIVIAATLFLLAIIGFPATKEGRESARRMACSNNLKQIALAMHRYEQAYGCFPPAYLPDKDGKPMHSWRVLLLPYLWDESLKSLYAQYHFDEPWDSLNNRKVSALAVGSYQCLSQPDRKGPTTNYMMVVGPHTISDGPHSRKSSEITDGLSNTIMIVEVADSGVRWAEPKDLEFDKIDFKINGAKRPGISSDHSVGAHLAFCDGSVRFLMNSTKPELVKAMLTIDGGEPIPKEP